MRDSYKREIKDKSPRESVFKRKLMKRLKAIPCSHWISKEAGSIRGISDILGSVNGYFVAIEVKRSEQEAKKYSPRSALQDKYLSDIRKVKCYSYKCFPENMEEVISELLALNVEVLAQ